MAIRFGSSSSINRLDETLGCKSLTLSRIRSIEDVALRFGHVAHDEEASHDLVCSIVNQRLRCRHESIEFHRANLLSAVLSLQMND